MHLDHLSIEQQAPENEVKKTQRTSKIQKEQKHLGAGMLVLHVSECVIR